MCQTGSDGEFTDLGLDDLKSIGTQVLLPGTEPTPSSNFRANQEGPLVGGRPQACGVRTFFEKYDCRRSLFSELRRWSFIPLFKTRRGERISKINKIKNSVPK